MKTVLLLTLLVPVLAFGQARDPVKEARLNAELEKWERLKKEAAADEAKHPERAIARAKAAQEGRQPRQQRQRPERQRQCRHPHQKTRGLPKRGG